MKDRVIYTKFSDDRAEAFSLYTNILKREDGSLYVKKCPASDRAMEHIRHIEKAGQELTKLYASEEIRVNPCFLEEDGICFSFAEGDTLENEIDRLFFTGKEEEAKELFIRFADDLLSLVEKDSTPFQPTEDFEKVFGKAEEFLLQPEKERKDTDKKADFPLFSEVEGAKEEKRDRLLLSSMKVSNIDLIPANIMISDGWEMIDYEWTFEFPIPVQFILYRMIYLYLNSSTRRSKARAWGLYERYGITEKRQEAYARMEAHFQSYIQGKRIRLDDIQIRMDPGRYDIAGMLEASMTSLDPYKVQIFFSDTEDFKEEDSLFYSGIKKGKNRIEVKLPKKANYLRIDPMAAECLIQGFSIMQKDDSAEDEKKAELPVEEEKKKALGTEENHKTPLAAGENQKEALSAEKEKEAGELLSLKRSNGISLKEGRIGFLTDDPQIYTKRIERAGDSFLLEFELLETEKEKIREICRKEEGLIDKIKARIKGR